jgi:hypothetical protein
MYELTGVMENVDNDLDRVRISASTAQQSRILTDLLVQARLAELDLEKMPLCAESCANVTTFINRTARECERMLAKLRLGERLSVYDYEVLEGLYKTNHQIRSDLDALTASMTDRDWTEFIKKGKGKIIEAVGNAEKLTLEENRLSFDKVKDKMEGAGIEIIDCDHDLGDYFPDGGDGIKLLDWLCERGTFYPIALHTANPVGRENMLRLIRRHWR